MPIKSDSEIMGGKPCIEGTRIPVSCVLRALAQYCQLGGIRSAYPHLRPEHAKEALWFAADRLDAENDDAAAVEGK